MELKHQALLLGYLIRDIADRFGKAGEEVIVEAIRAYGENRGKRMARTALENGCRNDLLGYLLFIEVDPVDTGNKFRIESRRPYFRVKAAKCGWHEIWRESGMLDVGRIYCRDIDKAMLQGFNSELRFDVPRNLNDGSPFCEFNYFDWSLGLPDLCWFLLRKRQAKKKALRSWDFHCVDVLTSFSRVVLEHLGEEGEKAIHHSLARFSEEFGEEDYRRLWSVLGAIDPGSPLLALERP
jgi:hypothetical protein